MSCMFKRSGKFCWIILTKTGSDRVLDKPFSPQVAVDLAWGTEGVKVAADRCEQQSGATQSSAAEEFSALWDPLHTGNGGHEADTAKTAHKVRMIS